VPSGGWRWPVQVDAVVGVEAQVDDGGGRLNPI
jgi:hypothetical protein